MTMNVVKQNFSYKNKLFKERILFLTQPYYETDIIFMNEQTKTSL